MWTKNRRTTIGYLQQDPLQRNLTIKFQGHCRQHDLLWDMRMVEEQTSYAMTFRGSDLDGV